MTKSDSRNGKTIIIGSNCNSASVSKQFLSLAEQLTKEDYQVIFLSQARFGVNNFNPNPKNSSVLFMEWPNQRPTKLRDIIFYYKLAKKYKPVLTISNFGATNAMILVGWLTGCPNRITWYHTIFDSQVKSNNPIKKLIKSFQILRKRFIYKLATFIVPVSYAAQEDVIKHYKVDPKKCRVIHNSLEDPKHENKRFYKKITCLGRLLKNKGQDIFIKAAEVVLAKVPDFTFEIVGSGKLKSYYEGLINKSKYKDRIILKPGIEPEEVLNLFSSAYASVVPSRFEAFPLVVVESMSVGTPVVASKVGGIPEAIAEGKDGFLFEVENYKQMAEKILLLINNPQLRNDLSLNARQKFFDQFEQKNNIERQISWINQLVGKPHSTVTRDATTLETSHSY